MRSILTDSLSDEWVSLSRGGGRIAEGSEKVDEGGGCGESGSAGRGCRNGSLNFSNN